jgi:hypothetical protein
LNAAILDFAGKLWNSTVYALSFEKYKGSNYVEFLKDKNVLLCTRLYKYAPNLESLLTQQYVCVMCTFWSDNTCVFTRFHSIKNANTQLIWSYIIYFLIQICKKIMIFSYCFKYLWRDYTGDTEQKYRRDSNLNGNANGLANNIGTQRELHTTSHYVTRQER